MRILILFLSLTISFSSFAQEYTPIPAQQVHVADTFYNTYVIEDNYRWLEKTDSPETVEWVAKQNELSKDWLKKAERKSNSFNEIYKNKRVRYNFPQKAGKYFFSFAYTDSRIGSSLLINTTRRHLCLCQHKGRWRQRPQMGTIRTRQT
jgi:prolyl oligopeptidase